MNRMAPPEKIDRVLDSVLKSQGYDVICKEQAVLTHWNDIAGSELAVKTECTRIENGIVYVRVESASWRQEICYLKPILLNKIHTLVNCSTIKDIVFY